MKDLLVFAHRGEAQSFMTSDVRPLTIAGLFEGPKYFLLLTGEGPFKALGKTNATLGLKSESIKNIINLGIAGTFNTDLKKGSIISIRTAYAYIGGSPQFKSFTSSDKAATHDVVTSDSRVLTDQNKNQYSPMSDIIDKEAWGVAQAAKDFNKNFYSSKLISDHIQEDVPCVDIKNLALVYSNSLKNYYDENFQHLTTAKKDRSLPNIFYATTYQVNRWSKLTKNLDHAVFHLHHHDEIYQKLQLHSVQPKKRMNIFLDYLEKNLFPERAAAQRNIEKELTCLKTSMTTVDYDKNFESEQIKLSALLSHSKDIDQLIEVLQKFQWDKYQTCFRQIEIKDV